MCYLDIWKGEDLKSPNHEFPYTHQIRCSGKGPYLASSPISLTSCSSPGPQPNGFHSPDSPWNYSGKPITYPSSRTSCYYKARLQRLCLFTLLPSAILVALPGAWCSPVLGYEYMWLKHCCHSHLPNVRCPVFNHLICNLSWRTLLSPMGVTTRQFKQLMWNIQKIYMYLSKNKNIWKQMS